MPLPTIGEDIYLPAPAAERERIADSVIMLANASGRLRGESAARREAHYRHRRFALDPRGRISPFAGAARAARLFAAPPEPSAAPDKRTIMQVRIGEALPSPTP